MYNSCSNFLEDCVEPSDSTLHIQLFKYTDQLMALVPVVLVAILVASANVACSSSFSKQPTVIRGYNGTCPLQEATACTGQTEFI